MNKTYYCKRYINVQMSYHLEHAIYIYMIIVKYGPHASQLTKGTYYNRK